MITHSDSLASLGPAIARVQEAVDHVAKSQTNPHFGSSYADLNAFLHALRGPLSEHGVLMTQAPGMDDGRVVLDTLLLHLESGEWIRNRASAPMQKSDPQGVGSATTYLRRYSLAALFAIPQEDDDGNAASSPTTSQAKPKPKRQPSGDEPSCPKCNGPLWDDRIDKRNPKAPDWKCKDKDGCGWAMWLDSARSELKERLEQLATRGIIKPATVSATMAAVQAGDLDSIRIAQDYVNGKLQEARDG